MASSGPEGAEGLINSNHEKLMYNNPLSDREEPLFHLFSRPTAPTDESSTNGYPPVHSR
jgi:hypothetical protein